MGFAVGRAVAFVESKYSTHAVESLGNPPAAWPSAMMINQVARAERTAAMRRGHFCRAASAFNVS